MPTTARPIDESVDRLVAAILERAVLDYFMTGTSHFHQPVADFFHSEWCMMLTDLDMISVLNKYAEVNNLTVYHYRGPVMRFGKVHSKLFDCYTSAKSEVQAINNIKSKYKTLNNLQQSAKIDLDPKYLTEEDIR